MRLLLVNPNTSAATTAMMLAVARAAAPVGVAVEGATATFGAALITDEAALAVAARAVVEAAKAAPGPFDGVVVSAFGDPGLEELREGAHCHVTGLAEAAMAEAAVGKRRFAVATTTPDLVAAIDRRAAAYGHLGSYAGTYVTPGDPAATIADPDVAAASLAALCRVARQDGVEAIVVGGGPLALAARRLAELVALPIIEPVPAAIRLAAARARGERSESCSAMTAAPRERPAATDQPVRRGSMLTRRTALAAGLAAPFVARGRADAQAPSRNETLLLVQEYGPNSLDMQGIGASQPVNGVSLNCYDRLLRFKPVPIPGGGGNQVAMGELEGELAESWQVASDGMSCTFKLRDAKFHSGRPVTAKDVKWSLDRAVSIGGFATTQMNAGSMEKPEQFVALDDKTFRVDFVRRDKMTMPNLAVTIPFVFDSELAIKNGGGDPWAKDWLKNNVAGSGAFKVESWKPGVETIYVRNDAWTQGALPQLRRVIARDIASPSTRRALIEKGDADISYGLPPKDFKDLIDAGKVKVVGVPIPNGVWTIYLNTAVGPFTDVRLRQAVAWVMPYEKIMQASLFGRGVDMSGGPATPKVAWPQPYPYATDLAKAKELVQAAGANGLSTTLLFDAGNATVAEPMSVLIKEALASIGINVEITKVPGANFRGEIAKKTNPMVLNRFAGWLDYPDYYLFWTLHGANSIFNIASYQNPELDKLIDAARFAPDQATYDRNVIDFVSLAAREVPMVPIAQPTHDVAMQKSIGGYQFQPCREPDFRYLTKGNPA